MSPDKQPDPTPEPIDVVDSPPQAPDTPAKQCPACGGRGVRSFATEDHTCSACNGRGRTK